MSPWAGLSYGFGVALTPVNLLAALGGALIGTALGILPGMSPTVACALLLMPTLGMSPETGLIMLGAVLYGTQYGDSMTAILMNVPSEAPSVVIAIDGYQLTKKGRSGAALAVAAIGSFIGASIGLVGLALIARPVGRLALVFGPPEYFAITVTGLFLLSRMSGSSISKGLVSLSLGLMLTTVGMDPLTGTTRFTFGYFALAQGFELVPVVIGLVGMAEMLEMAASTTWLGKFTRFKFREIFPSWREWKEAVPASLRGAGLGFLCGLLPGPTLALSTFVSYRLERYLAPTEVGHGAIRAVAGPKSADDGAISGTLVPLMALGIPFTPVTAVLFAGLLLHGLTPGPALMLSRPEIFWGLVAAMYVGNVALLILNFPLIGLWMSFLRIPQSVLLAMLVVLTLIGGYAVRNSLLDMSMVLLMGILGYVLKQLGFDRLLVILGVVLGGMLETTFRQSLELSRGDLMIFVQRPLSLALFIFLLIILLAPPIVKATVGHRRNASFVESKGA